MLRFRFLFAALAAIAILLVAPACTDQSEAPRFKLVDVTGATMTVWSKPITSGRLSTTTGRSLSGDLKR